jgi:hypothetical protein
MFHLRRGFRKARVPRHRPRQNEQARWAYNGAVFEVKEGSFQLMEIKLTAEEHATLKNGASAVRAFDNMDRSVSCSGQ